MGNIKKSDSIKNKLNNLRSKYGKSDEFTFAERAFMDAQARMRQEAQSRRAARANLELAALHLERLAAQEQSEAPETPDVPETPEVPETPKASDALKVSAAKKTT